MTGTLTVPLADDLTTEICKALNLDVTTVARMIIDLQAGMPVKVYIDSFADKAIEDVDWARFLTGANIKRPDPFIEEMEASHWTGLKTDYGSKTT